MKMRKNIELIAILVVLLAACLFAACDGGAMEELWKDELGNGSGRGGDDPVTVRCTVTFVSNGGSEVSSQTIKKGLCAVKPEDPTFGENTFSGWFLKGSSEEFDFSTAVNKDITLCAHWKNSQGKNVIETKIADIPKAVLTSGGSVNVEISPIQSKPTIVSIPAGAIAETADSSSELAITSYSIEVSTAAFEISGSLNNNLAVAGIDCALKIDDEIVSDFNKPIIITTYIPKGLSSVDVIYNGDAAKSQPDAGGTAPNKNVAKIYNNTIGETNLGYDKATGLLRFSTDHFSEFYVATNAEVCIVNDSDETDISAMTLGEFRNDVNNNNDYEGYTVTVLKDIDLQGNSWDPIGSIEWYNDTARPGYDTSKARPFSGTFEGNEHTISNMKIDKDSKIGGTVIKAGGFFGNVTGATIQNLNFVGAKVNLPNNEVVGIVVGGVLGGNFTIKNITIDNTSSVIAGDNIGAVVGSLFGDYDIASANFENIVSSATVSSSGAAYMGMVTGSIKGYKEITFKQCTNNGNIKLTGTPSKVTNGMIGGIVGYLQGNSPRTGMSPTTNNTTAKFISCVNNGELLGYNNAGGMVANILGGNQLDTVSFISCTNTGKVTVISGGNTGSTGGMFGYAGENNGITFTKCTNSGDIGDDNSKCSAGLFAWSQAPVIATGNSVSGTIVANVSPASAYALGYIQTPAQMIQSGNTNNTGLNLYNVK